MLCFLFSEQQLRTTAQPRIGPSMAESCIAVAVGEEAREAAEIVLSVSVINEGGGGGANIIVFYCYIIPEVELIRERWLFMAGL